MSPENWNKWGFPDGRDESSYPGNDSWSDDRWRWEFTRRRDDYLADFTSAAAKTVRLHKAMMAEAGEEEKKLYGPEHLDSDNADFMTTANREHFSRKYGIGLLMHPHYDFGKFPFHFCDWQSPAGGWPGYGNVLLPQPLRSTILTLQVPEGFAAMIFDLSKDLNAQSKELTPGLLEVQKRMFGQIHRRRKHRRTWLRYLRVIDARASGATLKDMADIAAPNKSDNHSEQNALQVWAAAEHLMSNWAA
jgi:hypothetical protein